MLLGEVKIKIHPKNESIHEKKVIYMKGQPDIMILNYNKSWKGFKIACHHCSNHFLSDETYEIHLKKFHKL